MRNGNNPYGREEVLDKLKRLYEETQRPITYSAVKSCSWTPYISVFNRLFGSLENACKEASIPFKTQKSEKIDERLKECRVSKEKETNINNQGCLMKIIQYDNWNNIIIEFQDEFSYRAKTTYGRFKSGNVHNPFAAERCGVGIIGTKYPSKINGQITKEFSTWAGMLRRCYENHDGDKDKRNAAYNGVTCCKEWLYYPNFYDWLHSQENFEKWADIKFSAIDKDILVKNNKVYSPDTCLLVPPYINSLFVRKNKNDRGGPPGTWKTSCNTYQAACGGIDFERIRLGNFKSPEDAFQAYKECKENVIKEVAEREYQKGTISKKCYEAMMAYKVEIND